MRDIDTEKIGTFTENKKIVIVPVMSFQFSVISNSILIFIFLHYFDEFWGHCRDFFSFPNLPVLTTDN